MFLLLSILVWVPICVQWKFVAFYQIKMWFLLALSLACAHPLLLQEGYEAEKSILGGDVYTKVLSEFHRDIVVNLPDTETLAAAVHALIEDPPKPNPNRLQQ